MNIDAISCLRELPTEVRSLSQRVSARSSRLLHREGFSVKDLKHGRHAWRRIGLILKTGEPFAYFSRRIMKTAGQARAFECLGDLLHLADIAPRFRHGNAGRTIA